MQNLVGTRSSPQSRILLKPLLCALSSGLHYSHWKAPPGAPVCALKEPRARFTRRHSKANTEKHVSSSWALLSHTTRSVSSRKRGARSHGVCARIYLWIRKQYTSTQRWHAEWREGEREGCTHIYTTLANSSVWIWSGGSRGVRAWHYLLRELSHISDDRSKKRGRRTMDAVVSRLCGLRDLIFACDRAQFTCTALSDLELCGSCWAWISDHQIVLLSQSLPATFADVTFPWLRDALNVSGDLNITSLNICGNFWGHL
jgi:hypothetical protein